MNNITIEHELLEKVRDALWQMTKHFNFGRLHESRLRDSEVRVAAHDAMKALEEALAAPATAPEQCWCRTCRPITQADNRMVLCPDCWNKRCPKATDHRNACTGSNEPGQPGSSYPTVPATAPEQPAWHDAPTEVKQIAEALRQIGLTLVRTSDGYKVLKLGAITAQEDKP